MLTSTVENKNSVKPRGIIKCRTQFEASLFHADETGNRKGKQRTVAPCIVGQDEMRQLRADTNKGKATAAGILTQGELERIKKSTKIETVEDKRATQAIFKETQETAQAASKARKAKMQAMDRERAHKVPPSHVEKEQKDKELGLLSKAQMQLDEEHDDVKHMNQMVMYSKIVTIRDKQLVESKGLEEEWLAEQKKLDLMMELERLKSLQEQEERDNRRAVARKAGAQVIIDQIAEREQERIKQRELLEKEKAQMLKNIEEMKVADQKVAEKKKVRNKEMVHEVLKANGISLDRKADKMQMEKDEDQKIVSYEAQKRAAIEAQLAEEKKLKDEKELEIKRLRDLQERAADRQAEIDALRQKRAFEESERTERSKEIALAEKKRISAKNLDVARKRQFCEREEMLGQQAKLERDSFLRVIEEHKRAEEEERLIDEQKKQHLRNHASTIRSQIRDNTEKTKQDRLDYLEEGRKVRQRLEDERLKVEGIKAKKLGGLKEIGIEDKYQAELAKKRIH